jgi:hypothetical protein
MISSKMAENKEEMLAAIPAISPVKKEHLTHVASGYGWRMHPILKISRMHNGIDFVAKEGTPIYASGTGTVMEAERSSSFGNVVKINHGFGYETVYAHLSRIAVPAGKRVKRGDISRLYGKYRIICVNPLALRSTQKRKSSRSGELFLWQFNSGRIFSYSKCSQPRRWTNIGLIIFY